MKNCLIFIFTSFLLFSCNTKVNKQNVVQQSSSVVDLPTITNFSLVKTKNGKNVYKIKANKAVIDEKNKVITVYKGIAEIYDKKISVAKVQFEVAKYDIVLGDAEFLGKNVISTIENEKIITYDIKYNSKENKIFSDKEIEIYKNGNVVKGIGFETFDGFQTIRIYKNVITSQ